MNSKDKIELYKQKIQDDPKNSDLYYELAKEYSELESLDEAILTFQKAIELNCQHVPSYIELANLLFAVDRIDKAIDILQLGIDYNPDNCSLYYLLEQIYELLGEYELASETLKSILIFDNNYTKAFEALGRLAIFQNDHDEALEWLNKLIEQDPKNVNGHIYLANIHRKKRNFDTAIEHLESALVIDPENLDIYNDLGLVYLESKNFDKAKEKFEFILSIDDTYSFAFDNLGVIYRKTKEYGKAIEILQKSLSMNLQAWTYNELALVYTEKGDYKESIECSKKALAIDDTYTYAYDNLGAVYRKLGYYDKAANILKDSLKLKPEDSWTYNQLGLLYYEKSDYITAKGYFTKSIELDEDHYWPKINLTSCVIKDKQYDLAKKHLEKLKSEYPENPRIYMLKSKIELALENYDEALKYAEIAVEKDPTDALVLTNIGVVYRDLKDNKLAEKYFELSLQSQRPKDSSVYLEYAIFNLFNEEYDKCLYNCVKAQERDELNHNIYSLMAIIQNSSNVETRIFDYIKDIEKRFARHKEVYICYACSYLELGIPEESEKYFKMALDIDNENKDIHQGLSQTYYLLKNTEESLNYAFYNTDSTENIEISSYSNALVGLIYKNQSNQTKFETYKNEALSLNSTIKRELHQKEKLRQNLKYKDRYNLFKSMYDIFS